MYMSSADQLIYTLSASSGGHDTSSPFVAKQTIWSSDVNPSQNYSNGQVIFELQSWASNSKFIDYADAQIVLPLVIQLNDKNGAVDFGANCSDLCLALKNSTTSLIDSIQVDVGNSSVIQKTPMINSYLSFKMNTEMSEDEEQNCGSLINYALDECESWSYNTAVSSSGVGICNNANLFPESVKTSGMDSLGNIFNGGMLKRQLAMTKRMGATNYGQAAIIGSTAQLQQNYKNLGKNYIDNSTGTAKYYHVNAIIRLRDLPLFNSPDFPRLIRGTFMRITLQINQCFFEFTKDAAGSLSAPANMMLTGSSNPLMIAASYKPITGQFGTLATNVAATAIQQPLGSAGLACGRTYQVSLSLCTTRYTHAYGAPQTNSLPSPRIYATAYSLNPTFEAQYLALGQKRITYDQILNPNVFYNVAPNQQFSFPITSGVSRAKRMIIVPYLSASSNYSEVAGFAEITSPYSSAPCTTAPLQLQNFQVNIGSIPLFSQPLNYTFELFNGELATTGSDVGMHNLVSGAAASRIGLREFSSGLFNYIVVDLRRRLPVDFDTLQNVSISGTVASLKGVDLYVFFERSESLVIDLASGQRIA